MRPATCGLTITSLPATMPVSKMSLPRGVVVKYKISATTNSAPTNTKNFESFIRFLPRQTHSVPKNEAYGLWLGAFHPDEGRAAPAFTPTDVDGFSGRGKMRLQTLRG